MLWHVGCLLCQGRTTELLLLFHNFAVLISKTLPSLEKVSPFGCL